MIFSIGLVLLLIGVVVKRIKIELDRLWVLRPVTWSDIVFVAIPFYVGAGMLLASLLTLAWKALP